MRILILGGAGMLGHELWRQYHMRYEVWVALRKPLSHYGALVNFQADRTLSGLNIVDPEALQTAFMLARPEVVINCVGVVKQLAEAKNPLISLSVNALLPHRIAQLCSIAGARLVHISTDCVFTGRTGNYTEESVSDAEDLYGRTKYLGEVSEPHCVTLRTSIIGRELETQSGLIEWFLSQKNKRIKGFRKAIYTGFTTIELARIIEHVLVQHEDLNGVWQVSSNPIDKYQLLALAKTAFNWTGEIEPDDSFVCDRSLDSSKFRRATGYIPPSWPSMTQELADKR